MKNSSRAMKYLANYWQPTLGGALMMASALLMILGTLVLMFQMNWQLAGSFLSRCP